ncbi:MAG TPA: hypothetical protein VIL04_07375 [Solirubrobacterales bacterium]
MDLLLAWLALPLLLAALAGGLGLLVERLAATRIPGALVPVAGLAAVAVVGAAFAAWPAVAPAGTVALAALAAAGWGWVVLVRRPLRVDPAAAVVAGAAFACFALPIVASGEATFAGYVKLDDTATWLALVDHVLSDGRDLSNLEPSTYEATLAENLADGYPVGALVPFGVAAGIVGLDPAWAIQPYMAFAGALLALALWELGRPVVRSRTLRAVAAVVASQAALLHGYYLWGGVKEVFAAALVAGLAPLALRAGRGGGSWRALVPPGVVAAGLVAGLSAGGLAWALPALLGGAVLLFRERGPRAAAEHALAFAALLAALCAPQLAAGLVPPTSAPLTDDDAIGNLAEPLGPERLAGIWPAADFRFAAEAPMLTAALIAIAAAAGAAGVWLAWRRGAPGLPVYVGGAVAVALALLGGGSPWVGAKALAIASPAMPLAAALAGAAWLEARPRALGIAAVAALVAGIAWSSALAYRGVSLAPRDQLTELAQVGERLAGRGPVLLAEYQPYGARHFLREAAPEAPAELRRRRVPLRDGSPLERGRYADVDRFATEALFAYRALVLRRHPGLSRPPSGFERTWAGRFYEVWERREGARPPRAHLPLGSPLDRGAVPRCAAVRRLAARAALGEVIVAGPAGESVVARLAEGSERVPEPAEAEVVRGTVELRRGGKFRAWLGGSLRGAAAVRVDGASAGEARHRVNHAGGFTPLGTLALGPGRHEVELRLSGPDLHPGSGGGRELIGPVVLTSEPPDRALVRVRPGEAARRLCGRRWDWIELAPAARPRHIDE